LWMSIRQAIRIMEADLSFWIPLGACLLQLRLGQFHGGPRHHLFGFPGARTQQAILGLAPGQLLLGHPSRLFATNQLLLVDYLAGNQDADAAQLVGLIDQVGLRFVDLGRRGRQFLGPGHRLQFDQLSFRMGQVGLAVLPFRLQLPVVQPEKQVALLDSLPHLDRHLGHHPRKGGADANVLRFRLDDARAGHSFFHGFVGSFRAGVIKSAAPQCATVPTRARETFRYPGTSSERAERMLPPFGRLDDFCVTRLIRPLASSHLNTERRVSLAGRKVTPSSAWARADRTNQ
jgi:hypothetical protein